jgi:DNA polymerase
MLNIFRAGGDPYAAFGSQMFNIPGLTKESHPDLRQSAKSALLGCGYGLGWASFAAQLLVGFLGAPPVRYNKAFAKQLGVTAEYVEKFLAWDDNVKKLLEIPHICTQSELLIHCVAAKKIIDIYRATAYPVVGFWNMCSSLMVSSLAEGHEFVYKCLTFRKEEIVLPNGMSLRYPNLRQVTDKETKQKNWVYGKDETKLYAGKITNNVTQAVARIVMTDGMLRTTKKYFVAGTVHDEQIVVVPDAEVEFAKTWVLAQMTMEPSYLPGIPLAADGGANQRYGLAKN